MATALKLSDELIELARPHAAVMQRSVPKQIEYWARLGKLAEENPDLPVPFIQETMLGLAQAEAGEKSDYVFGA